MEVKEEIIRQKLKDLITESCHFNTRPQREFQKFHKTLLNFFFNSVDLNIDYEKNLISIWNSKPLTTNPVRLYDLNEAISDKVGYTDLEETLFGCIEDGQLQNNFYEKLLFEYGNCLRGDEDFLSA